MARRPTSGSHIRRWGAIYILIVLFIGSWMGQLLTSMAEFADTQAQHGQPFQWSPFLYEFFAATLENWQSEWLQLIFQAILLMGAKHWLFQTDAEDLERIEDKLDTLLVGAEHTRRNGGIEGSSGDRGTRE